MNLPIGKPSLPVLFKATYCLLMFAASTLSHGQTSPIHSTKKPVKHVTASRAELNTKANQMASGIRAAEAALTPTELAIAQRVEVGKVACELGVNVDVKADAKVPGYFDVQGKKFKYRMTPVVTGTGAIRLEDARAGAVWLQLANKSMLMNQKLGSRIADACMTSAQSAVALAMEKNPPLGLLEPAPTVVQPATAKPPVVLPTSVAIQ